MFIRQTKTSNAASGEAYLTYRLVASVRFGGKVRQQTLLNLGRNFSLPREQWPQLCARIEQLLGGQLSIIAAPVAIEAMAQRYAARLVEGGGRRAAFPEPHAGEDKTDYQEVDVNSLELIRPRSAGVEHVGLAALDWLELPRILEEAGCNGSQRAAAIGAIIGRMAMPGSELATWRWLRERSGLGEMLGVDFEGMPLMGLYRASDLLIKYRQTIEERLFSRIETFFSLPATVTLYDLTNTYFEGAMESNPKAQRGHSKEKRSDCPLVTLGLVLDGSGFVRRSRMFAGNVTEAATLDEMLTGLATPAGALVIMDRGIATEANIGWLRERGYRYLVVSRERRRQFDEDQAQEFGTASGQKVRVQRVLSDDGSEARLYCHSEERQEKESAITRRFAEKFEQGLMKLAAGLEKPHAAKDRDKILQRIGRLVERSHGLGQQYEIEVTAAPADSSKAAAIIWQRRPAEGSRLTHPGVYCLRTNELNWDEATLWQTYTMLTDLEAVFRSLKSELGLRPVYHHKEARADGHLFITVLAYQAVQAIRWRLKAKGIGDSWQLLREVFASQQRVTATFRQKDGRTLHIRKATVAGPRLVRLYESLGLPLSPGRVQKLIN